MNCLEPSPYSLAVFTSGRSEDSWSPSLSGLQISLSWQQLMQSRHMLQVTVSQNDQAHLKVDLIFTLDLQLSSTRFFLSAALTS